MSIQDDAKAQAELEARARRRGVEPFALRMAEAVSDTTMRDILCDNRRNVHDRPGVLPKPPRRSPAEARKPEPHSHGWVAPAPLRNGYNRHIEAQLDAQDAIDRAARERQFGKRGE